MKKFFLYLFSLTIAILVLLGLKKYIDDLVFLQALHKEAPPFSRMYYSNLTSDPSLEHTMLSGTDSSGVIYVFGSSELTSYSEALPFNFISNNFKNKVVGIGHAGNQCFSIYSQLLAHEDRLNGAPVFIILSPGWFANKGTSSECFLEYNSSTMMNAILNSEKNDEFKKYEMQRVADLYPEFTNPDVNFRMMFLENKANQNSINRIFLSPLIYANSWLNSAKEQMFAKETSPVPYYKNVLVNEHKKVAWDSLFAASKKEKEESVTNNSWGINDEYYSTYINGNRIEMYINQGEDNTEWQDFTMLVRMLKEKKVNASFMILPMNPFYYTNTKELTPFISKLNQEVILSGFPCLNMWNDDTTTFDKALLKDVMHLSSYGFYKVDEFLVNTYKLTK
jgi:D-alanine transfer protein